jgi:hypothetical protein
MLNECHMKPMTFNDLKRSAVLRFDKRCNVCRSPAGVRGVRRYLGQRCICDGCIDTRRRLSLLPHVRRLINFQSSIRGARA